MKKVHSIFCLCCLLLAFTACDREKLDYAGGEGEGQMVELKLKEIVSMQVKETPASRAAANTDDYIISLYKADNTLVELWTYKEMPELVSVLSGDYYIKAASHKLLAVDTKPYFEGKSASFSVKPSAITEVQPVVCEMKNIKTIVTFDEALKKFLGKDVTVTIVVGDNSYTYSDLEEAANNPIYFAPVEGEVNVVYVLFDGTVDDYKENFTKTYKATSGTALDINFTLKNVSDDTIQDSGFITMKMRVDVSVTVINKDYNITDGEDVIPEVPDGGDGEDETKPTIVGRGFNINEAQVVPDDGSLICIVDMTAANRMAHLYVTIDSNVLTEDELAGVGLTKSFDLAYPGDLENSLGEGGLKFPVGNQVIGQKTLAFDITTFVPLLAGLGSGTHKFIIKVVDQKNLSMEETLTIITK